AGVAAVAPMSAYAQAASAPEATPAPAAEPASAAAEPAAPAVATAPAPKTEKEVVENPYGLAAMWSTGDVVSKFVLIALVIMSMGTWYIMFTKLFEQQKVFNSAKEVAKGFWNAGSVKAGTAALKEGSAFRYIAESGMDASQHHEGTLVEQIDLHT